MSNFANIDYICSGLEGNTITTADSDSNIPNINGKHISKITRETRPTYRVSSDPKSDEYTWDGDNVIFGINLLPRERLSFLIQDL